MITGYYLLIGVADVFGAQTMCTRPARRPQSCPTREIFARPMPPDPTDTLTPAGRARSTDRTLDNCSYETIARTSSCFHF